MLETELMAVQKVLNKDSQLNSLIMWWFDVTIKIT